MLGLHTLHATGSLSQWTLLPTKDKLDPLLVAGTAKTRARWWWQWSSVRTCRPRTRAWAAATRTSSYSCCRTSSTKSRPAFCASRATRSTTRTSPSTASTRTSCRYADASGLGGRERKHGRKIILRKIVFFAWTVKCVSSIPEYHPSLCGPELRPLFSGWHHRRGVLRAQLSGPHKQGQPSTDAHQEHFATKPQGEAPASEWYHCCLCSTIDTLP